MQDQDYEFFLQNIEELYKLYGKKFIVIKNRQILGIYNDFGDALDETLKTEEIGTFIIQECFQNKKECVHNYQNNVIPLHI